MSGSAAPDGVRRNAKALLDACAELVARLLKFDHPADATVSRYFDENRQLESRTRAVVADTGYAVLRHKLLYEYLARDGPGPRHRLLAILAFAGAADVLHAALSDDESRWLATCDRDAARQADDRCRHNLPSWLAQALQLQVGAGFWALVESLERSAPPDLRVNTLVAKRPAVLQALGRAGVECEPTPYSPCGVRVHGKPALKKLDVIRLGHAEVQDEGSQLLALLLDARREQLVVDFCAGAGGKTLALGAAMRNTGRLYAFDVSAHRLEALKPRLARSGLGNVHPMVIAHERDDRLRRLLGKADRVIVDAPCSGLGTLRRHPDLKWRQSAASVAQLAERQLQILTAAAALVGPSGRLVYATCSLLDSENQAVAQAFEAAGLGFRPVAAAQVLLAQKVEHADRLCDGEGGRYLHLWPHLHGTDGFFAAVWERA